MLLSVIILSLTITTTMSTTKCSYHCPRRLVECTLNCGNSIALDKLHDHMRYALAVVRIIIVIEILVIVLEVVTIKYKQCII